MTFTTNDWGGSRSVTFSADTSSVKYNSATASATVNKIHIAAGKLKISGIEYASKSTIAGMRYASEANISIIYGGQEVDTFSIERGDVTNADLDLTIPGLSNYDATVTMNYTTTVTTMTAGSATTSGTTTKSISIKDMISDNGAEITFTSNN